MHLSGIVCVYTLRAYMHVTYICDDSAKISAASRDLLRRARSRSHRPQKNIWQPCVHRSIMVHLPERENSSSLRRIAADWGYQSSELEYESFFFFFRREKRDRCVFGRIVSSVIQYFLTSAAISVLSHISYVRKFVQIERNFVLSPVSFSKVLRR